MRDLKSIFLLIAVVLPLYSQAQSALAPLNSDYYHTVDRYEILGGKIYPGFFTSWKGYERADIADFVDSLKQEDYSWSKSDAFNLEYLSNDNWEFADSSNNESRKPILKHFYRKKSDFYHVDTEDFDLHINPVIYFMGGTESASSQRTYINTRGVEIRGMIDKKVGFYSFIGENQAIFPEYVMSDIRQNIVVPHEGFWKGYNDNGVDFLTARGYITFNATKHINLQFGHDRFKVGNGYRSLILSDYAPGYLFLKMQTKVWKLNYTNLFTEMTANVEGNSTGLTGSRRYDKKFMSLHHLSLNIGKKLNVGVFEAVIFSNPDSSGNNSYELKYLNPIIFYRAIEQQNGSSDNVLLGADFKWFPIKKVSLYGQFVLDEFVLENFKSGNGWWGNKYSLQLGAEYVNALGIDNLDLQVETNIARPYIYSHDTDYGSYSHYNQSLAHPLGANFNEVIGILRYQPMGRLQVTAKLIRAEYGTDGEGQNWGGNILLRNQTREQNENNEIGQGIGTTLMYGSLALSYQFKHNLFVDLTHIYRDLKSDQESLDENTNYTSLALRWNIPHRYNEF
ncbi:hypothetical protein LVD15_10985 [Fulvivirga maritima]|uniref:hypothetical protein n=1 Tax=Fulvivirga maritima TaxID=2904247 RepID=UPI001F30A8E2|nr:hypothetical protein [Fulvivirga maritima]UII28924.1 hypothetical protein LVD15_10985 [Fulvivirga maritima]